MKRFLALIALVPVVFLGAFAAGCGDSDSSDSTSSNGSASTGTDGSDEAEVRAVAAQVVKYTKAGDAKGMCSLFVPGRLEDWIGEGRCVEVFREGLKQKLRPDQMKIRKVEIDGENAKVTMGYSEVPMMKVDGKWYLETPDVEVPEEVEGQ